MVFGVLNDSSVAKEDGWRSFCGSRDTYERKGIMNLGRTVLFGITPAVCLLGAVAADAFTQTGQSTPPRVLVISANPVDVNSAVYSFEVSISDFRVVNGIPQLRLSTNIVKTKDSQVVRFRDIILHVLPDASSVSILADGQRFVLEASYLDTPMINNEPRRVSTTFGKMFAGGEVGIVVRALP
jgi:hypothetical protein